MSCFPVFPEKGSIIPAGFYNIQGLPTWLNNNPSYKEYFVGVYPYLYNMTSSLSTIGYNINSVTIASDVTALSNSQSILYNQQLSIFSMIYAHNSNAYVNHVCSNTPLIYYTYKSYQEKTKYDAAVGLITKLYPLSAMANGPGWIVPFPL